MKRYKLLIVEDGEEEAKLAQADAESLGFTNIAVATTLEEALKELPAVQGVLSDLFFPVGNVPTETYTKQFLSCYQQAQEQKSQQAGTSGTAFFLSALETCAEYFNVSMQEYIDNHMMQMGHTPQMVNAARSAVNKVKDYDSYQKLAKVIEDISAGKNLPLGIIVAEQAERLGIPAVIVTSTHHHDAAFEPVRGLMKIPYVDTLNNGKKNWGVGVEKLLALPQYQN